MKNKILILTAAVGFVLILVLMNIFLNSQNDLDSEIEMSGKEENVMDVLNVTSANFKEEVLNSEKTVLIDFYADWCGPCKMFSPVVEAVANENEDIKVVKVNVDNAQDLAIQYQVMSIPTVVIIKDGKEINRNVGMVSKSQLLEMVK